MTRSLYLVLFFLLSACASRSATSSTVTADLRTDLANKSLPLHPDCVGLVLPEQAGFNGETDSNFIKLELVRVGAFPVRDYNAEQSAMGSRGPLFTISAKDRPGQWFLPTARGLKVFGKTYHPSISNLQQVCFASARVEDVAGQEDMSADLYGANRHRVEFHARLAYAQWVRDSDRSFLLNEVKRQNASRAPFGFSASGDPLDLPFIVALAMHQDPVEGWSVEGVDQTSK